MIDRLGLTPGLVSPHPMQAFPHAEAPFLQDPSATIWKLGSADPLAANTPSDPTAVSPVKAGVGVTLRKTIELPPVSVAVLVVS